MVIKILDTDNIHSKYLTHFKKTILDSYIYIREIENFKINDENKIKILKEIDNITNKYNKKSNILIYLINNNIMGYLWYIKEEINKYDNLGFCNDKKEYVWIHSIFVDPSVRKEGICKSLYMKLKEMCINENIEKIYSNINPLESNKEIFYNKIDLENNIIYSINE